MCLAVCGNAVHAGNYTWTNATSGGLWSVNSNWSSAPIFDSTAVLDFSTLDLTADNTTRADGSYTVNRLIFGDATTVSNAWTVDDNGNPANVLTLDGATPTIQVASSTATIQIAMAGSAGLTKTGNAQLILSAANTYTGTTALQAGQTVLSSGATLGSSANALAIGGNTTVARLTLNENLTQSSLRTVANSSGTSTLVIDSGRKLTINGAVTIGGTTAGGNHRTVFTGGGSFEVLNSGGTFQVGGVVGSGQSTTLTLNMDTLGTFSANLGTNGMFQVGDIGTGAVANQTVRLAETSTITTGTLSLGPLSTGNPTGIATVFLGSGTNTISASTVHIGGTRNRPNSGFLGWDSGVNTGTLKMRGSDGSAAVSAMNVLVTNINTGNAMSGTCDFRGHGVDVAVTTLNIGRALSGNSRAPLNAALLFDSGTFTATSATIGSTAGGGGAGAGTNTINASLTIGGGTAAIGSLVLGGTNQAGNTGFFVTTINARFNVTGGTATFNGPISRVVPNSAATTSSTVSLNGGTLDMGGFSIGSVSSQITLTAAAGTLRNLSELNGGANLFKTTSGTLVLAGNNTYSGTTVVQAGVLTLAGSGHAGSFDVQAGRLNVNTPNAFGGSSGQLTLGSGVTLDNTSGGDVAVSAAEPITLGSSLNFLGSNRLDMGTGQVTLTSDATIDVAANSLAFGGSLTGVGLGVTKTGPGTLVLGGASSYTGTTSVQAGTLTVNGSLANTALDIAAGATLRGSGTIGGLTTIAGTHAPGNSPGVETLSDLTYLTGASVVWELWNNTVSNGSLAFDQVVVTGDLNFSGASTTLSLVFTGSESPTNFSSVAWSDPFWGSNRQWLLYDVAGSTTGFGNLVLNTTNWTDSTGAAFETALPDSSFSLIQIGQDVYLDYVVAAVPEPGGLVLATVGVALGGWSLRRRRVWRRRPRAIS